MIEIMKERLEEMVFSMLFVVYFSSYGVVDLIADRFNIISKEK
jgi:hypothetical protein